MDRHAFAPLFEPRSVLVLYDHALSSLQDSFAISALSNGAPLTMVRVQPGARVDATGPFDLAVVAVAPTELANVVDELIRLQVRCAVVLGFVVANADEVALAKRAADAGVLLLGPQSFGFQRPELGLNASLHPRLLRAGATALVSQSGALTSAILDWAEENSVGFSAIVSMGAEVGMRTSQVIEYLASDPRTQSIVAYIEGVNPGNNHARDFMSALRAAASVKPVVILKGGRGSDATHDARTHAGAMVGSEAVFNAALRRAGAVRVQFFTQLFSAVKCLASRYRPTGSRLAIVANGRGPALLARDWASEIGLARVEFSDQTHEALQPIAPLSTQGAGIPVMLALNHDSAQQAVQIVAADDAVDGVLALITPDPTGDLQGAVQGLIAAKDKVNKPYIACLMGEKDMRTARKLLDENGVPAFRTPESAVDAFGNLATFAYNQQLLRQVPGPQEGHDAPDVEGARILIEAALAERRVMLSETECKALLAAFHVPVAHTIIARSPAEAIIHATQLGFPVVLKINSIDIPNKMVNGGVLLNVRNSTEVRNGFADLMNHAKRKFPHATVDGVAVQPMSAGDRTSELYIGAVTDPVFGPVISFGAGGTMIELIRDRALELPPLNQFLAHKLIERSRAHKALIQYFNSQPLVEQLEQMLLRVSQMLCELPYIEQMDINPIVIHEGGAVAVDARIVLRDTANRDQAYSHMTLHPYPAHLQRSATFADGTQFVIRPVKPEDAQELQTFMRELSDETRYMRFISTMRELPPRMLARYTLIDYHREMALIATVPNDNAAKDESPEHIICVARYLLNADGTSAEYALVVGDAWQGKGLGGRLMSALEDAARAAGLKRLEGYVLASNQNMQRLMGRLGYTNEADPDDHTMRWVYKDLQ